MDTLLVWPCASCFTCKHSQHDLSPNCHLLEEIFQRTSKYSHTGAKSSTAVYSTIGLEQTARGGSTNFCICESQAIF